MKPFERFQPVSDEMVLQYIKNMNKTHCPNDPIDMRRNDFTVVGNDLSVLVSEIINKSLDTGNFPESKKFFYVRPLIKAHKEPNDLLLNDVIILVEKSAGISIIVQC